MQREARSLASSYQGIQPKIAQRKTRFDARHGEFHSEKTLAAAFAKVSAQLAEPLGDLHLAVDADLSAMEITATTSWHEQIGEFPISYHQLDLLLKFKKSSSGGLKVTYDWVATDFPRSPLTNRLIRTVNIMVAAVLMLL